MDIDSKEIGSAYNTETVEISSEPETYETIPESQQVSCDFNECWNDSAVDEIKNKEIEESNSDIQDSEVQCENENLNFNDCWEKSSKDESESLEPGQEQYDFSDCVMEKSGQEYQKADDINSESQSEIYDNDWTIETQEPTEIGMSEAPEAVPENELKSEHDGEIPEATEVPFEGTEETGESTESGEMNEAPKSAEAAEETAEPVENAPEAVPENELKSEQDGEISEAAEVPFENGESDKVPEISVKEDPSEAFEKSRDEQINEALNGQRSFSEVKELVNDNSGVIDDMKGEYERIEKESSDIFDEVLGLDPSSVEYRKRLQEYNTFKDNKERLGNELADAEKNQGLLREKELELREAQIEKGEQIAAGSETAVNCARALEDRFDQEFYNKHPSKSELRDIRSQNEGSIAQMCGDRDALKLAMEAKMDDISDYVMENNMGRYETSMDMRYKEMTDQYLELKRSYDRMNYSIGKLDENNILISRELGDGYTSVREVVERSGFAEIREGNDVPGVTDYHLDDPHISECLSKFEQSNWETMSLRAKEKEIRNLADANGDLLGIEDKPRVVFYNKESDDDYGWFSSEQNAIFVNRHNIASGEEAADTISHEYRHRYQHERAEKLENQRDLEFKDNFEDYISPEDNYFGYVDQPVEKDACAYASMFREKILGFSQNNETAESGKETSVHESDNADVSDSSQNRKFRNISETDEISSPAERMLSREFITNDGDKITYDAAVNRILSSSEGYMDSMGIHDNELRQSILTDMRGELIKQQLESERRGLGDHGIRHIYGNFERGEQYLESNPEATDRQKMSVLVAQVYHDEGYTLSPNNIGTLHEGNNDSGHDKSSLDIWNDENRQQMYNGIFRPEEMRTITDAIGTHNTNDHDEIMKNTSRDSDLVISTVHICDKLALSQREKFSELISSDPELVELVENINSMNDILRKEEYGFYDGKNLSKSGMELCEQYHDIIDRHIDSRGYDADYADRLKDAVDKDVGFNSGYFSSRMNYIYVPSDCYQFNADTGRNEITVYQITRPGEEPSGASVKQIEKLYDDLGMSDPEIESAMKNNGVDFGEKRGLSVNIKQITEEEIAEMERKRFQQNDDLREVNERINAGRRRYEEMSIRVLEGIKYTEPENLSTNTKLKLIVQAGNFDIDSEREWTHDDILEIRRRIISQTVMNNARSILRVED